MNRLKKILSESARQSNGTQGWFMVVIGGYLVYMGFQMVWNTKTGISAMPMSTSVILMIVMCLAGLAVLAYGGMILKTPSDKEKKNGTADREMPDNKEENSHEDSVGI